MRTVSIRPAFRNVLDMVTDAFSTDPTTMSAFSDQIVNTISEIDAGHACYKIDALERGARAGENATIQLEYSSEFEGENNGNEQKFYACADVVCVHS